MDPMTGNLQIINIRETPAYMEQGIHYFSSRWGLDRRIYEDCMRHSITTPNPLPRWYLLLSAKKIIGGFGLITNDLLSRQDLLPWLCALYIEEPSRGRDLGAMLLNHGRREAGKIGFGQLYLCTHLTGYYEKYGWTAIGVGYNLKAEVYTVYQISTRTE